MLVQNSDKTAPQSHETSEKSKKLEPSNSNLVASDGIHVDDETVLDIFGKNMEFSLLENSDDSVQGLYLYKNVFNLIPKSAASHQRLRKLKFFGNEINWFPHEFGGILMGLESLQVKISTTCFGGLLLHKLKGLKKLELSKVPPPPSAFPILSEIAGLKCLTKLSVCHFSIRVLPLFSQRRQHSEMTTYLPASIAVTPRICINKEGTLLAVVANENRIKILATNRAHHLLRTTDKHSVDTSSKIAETLRKLTINPSSIRNDPEVAEVVFPKNEYSTDVMDSKSLKTGEALFGNKCWELCECVWPSLCRSLMLSALVKANKISRLTYTNSGNAILVLATNALHLLWKWPKNEYNLTRKATAKAHPQLRQPKGGLLLMSNDLTDSNPKEAFRCIALAKNDSYLLSSRKGPISLFNTLTFKRKGKVHGWMDVVRCHVMVHQ